MEEVLGVSLLVWNKLPIVCVFLLFVFLPIKCLKRKKLNDVVVLNPQKSHLAAKKPRKPSGKKVPNRFATEELQSLHSDTELVALDPSQATIAEPLRAPKSQDGGENTDLRSTTLLQQMQQYRERNRSKHLDNEPLAGPTSSFIAPLSTVKKNPKSSVDVPNRLSPFRLKQRKSAPGPPPQSKDTSGYFTR